MKILAKKVSNVMNQKFRKSLICLTGINANFSEINIDSKENTLIWFLLKDKNFLVFKPYFEQSITDTLIEARKSDSKLVIIKDGMPEGMKNWTIVMLRQAIITFNDTESISKHMIKSLELQFKNSWYSIITISCLRMWRNLHFCLSKWNHYF